MIIVWNVVKAFLNGKVVVMIDYEKLDWFCCKTCGLRFMMVDSNLEWYYCPDCGNINKNKQYKEETK